MAYPPRSTSSPKAVSLDRSASSRPSTEAPSYRLDDFGSSQGSARPQGVQLRDRDYAYETDPLTHYTSPQIGHHEESSSSAGGGAQQQRRDGADNAFSDVPYSPTGRGGSLDLSDAYVTDNTYPAMRTESISTHNSRSPLRHDGQQPPMPPLGQPIHPGASVSMQKQDSTQSTPEKRYGSNAEKSGYNSPRARSHDRGASGGGLGNWSGPGGNRSPYGQLGANSAPNSGLQSAASSNPNLLYADGDFIPPPSNAFSRAVFAVYDSNFLVRWIIYIIPLMALLWIPGIIGLTWKPEATVWTVPLVWWSGWLSVVWGGWWGAALIAKLGPKVLHYTVGTIAPELRHYITYVKAIEFYTGAAGWALANWVSFLPLIRNHATGATSNSTLSLCTQGLFGIFLVLLILLVEKLCIQVIAHNFHKKSYEDRIDTQKQQIKVLVALYVNTRDLGRSDTLDNGGGLNRPKNRRQQSDPTLLVKSALKNVKKVAQTATTVIGTVASEIAGEQVLKPNSAPSMVTAALGSANKSKQLAKRIYYSFCPSYRSALLLEDISRCFQNREQADTAFSVFDRDGNGDASLEEIELSLMDIHRERLALGRSMRDIDSAVGRLDNIVMSVWYVVSVLILAGLMNASFNTMITSAGTLILGLSWLIGTTAQEILASIIFLFIKHVYDVGDRVDIDGVSYIVLEMQLLSSVFKKTDGTVVQAPHSILNTKFINNIRRSGAISETFNWDVDFSTPFEKIEALRSRMLEFLEVERRDFLPSIDITVQDFAGQGKLSLSAQINFRSNWQNGALKAQRRNKWICALKLAMASLEVYGPADAGNPSPAPADPVQYQQVPYEAPKEGDVKADEAEKPSRRDVLHSGEELTLDDPRAVMEEEAGPFDEKRRRA